MSKYPMIDKYDKVSEAIALVLDFFAAGVILPAKESSIALNGITLMDHHETREAIVEFYGIDLKQLEAEQKQMLEDFKIKNGVQ